MIEFEITTLSCTARKLYTYIDLTKCSKRSTEVIVLVTFSAYRTALHLYIFCLQNCVTSIFIFSVYRTALHLACARGHADIVKVLLEWHAKSNVGDGESKTPLLKVCQSDGYNQKPFYSVRCATEFCHFKKLWSVVAYFSHFCCCDELAITYMWTFRAED
jgi:hypothetical protein